VRLPSDRIKVDLPEPFAPVTKASRGVQICIEASPAGPPPHSRSAAIKSRS
jgi:hypothetical protein